MKLLTLKLVRDIFSPNETLGKLYANGKFFCFTLEDKDRDLNMDGDLSDAGEGKVMHETAIPYGKYDVVLEYSNRFKRFLPEIKGVKTHAETKFHGGNHRDNSSGCPLVAYNRYINKPHPTITKINNWIQGSAEKDLVALIKQYDKCILIVSK